MSPQEIAKEAARRILVKSPVTQQHLEEAVEYNAALILTAAAKMVRESGAVDALEESQQMLVVFCRERGWSKHPTVDKNAAALFALRALTDHSGKQP